MPGVLKKAKKALRTGSASLIDRATGSDRTWVRERVAPLVLYADMIVNDYGVIRLIYNNQHRIADDVWRSAQPTPGQIAALAREGVKTVINLRSDQTVGTRQLERDACARHGMTFVDVPLKSRAAPSRSELLAMRKALTEAAYPILIHCKSGADRAGLMSVMVRHVHEGVPIEEARRQLSFKFGHVRQSDTGVLGHVFDRYVADNRASPIDFWDWVETRYDPSDVTASFRSKGWANRLVNDLLKRE